MRTVMVCGAGGFIGNHLVAALKKQGAFVIGTDIKLPEFDTSAADVFHLADLSDANAVKQILHPTIDEVYQLAADMGGAGFIFSGDNDAAIMSNSVGINLNILRGVVSNHIPKIFYSSSACVYPFYNQESANAPVMTEASAYPASPDSEYGWEKLFSERLYKNFHKNYGVDVRIARFHNVFGPLGTWQGGREKAPAALCRKIVEVAPGGTVEIWGPGNQTRSFLYINECIEGIQRLMNSNYTDPINIGSSRMISINDLALLISGIANKPITINNVNGPRGVMGRNSDNQLIQSVLGWQPPDNLEHGLSQLYHWIEQQVNARLSF